GITRLLGVLAELNNDEDGLVLPAQVAPFQVYLIDLTDTGKGEQLYKQLSADGFEVLFDDRSRTAGEKFAESDLIGIPIRLVYSNKTAKEQSVELKKRSEKDTQLVKLTDITHKLGQILS